MNVEQAAEHLRRRAEGWLGPTDEAVAVVLAEVERLTRERDEWRDRAMRAGRSFEQLLRWSAGAISDRSVILGMGAWTESDVLLCADLDATPTEGGTR